MTEQFTTAKISGWALKQHSKVIKIGLPNWKHLWNLSLDCLLPSSQLTHAHFWENSWLAYNTRSSFFKQT